MSREHLQSRPRNASAFPPGWLESKLEVRSEISCQTLVDVAGNKTRTLRHHNVSVSPGDCLCAGDIVAEGSCISGGEVAVGKNLVVAYLSFEGYNYEDAIVISKRCVREDLLTSIHLEEVETELEPGDTPTSTLVGSNEPLDYLVPRKGLAQEGTWLEEDDVVIGITRLAVYDGMLPQPKDVSLRVPHLSRGRVVDCRIVTKRKLDMNKGMYKEQRVATALIAVPCRVQIGDKLAGRHGNKGIVANILDDRDMPYLPDGTPVDIVLNPLGVPSRMNVGQIFECLLGTAGRWTGQHYRVGPFDEMFAEEASRGLVFNALSRARDMTGYQWLLDPQCPGKTQLYDGKTGHPFDQPVTAGVTYIIKLYHMVRDKIHARKANSSYSLLTQQPTKGRVRGGGQRLGEMEVSALVGYGAHATLQEMMTVKSDDVLGRDTARRNMECGIPVELPQGATSEGYLTFKRELAASGFAVREGSFGDRDHRDKTSLQKGLP